MNYLVVGLGNPGEKYKNTRHNVGWIVLDALVGDTDWNHDAYAQAVVAPYKDNFTFVKPQTFMNLSGESVRYFLEKKGFTAEQCVVVYDDIDLPLGKMKISFDRGSGGHNGIKSIEQEIGTRQFIRIRIGISKIVDTGELSNSELVKPNVLGNFEESELKQVADISKKIGLALYTLHTEGLEKAMTEFNSSDPHIKVPKSNPEEPIQ